MPDNEDSRTEADSLGTIEIPEAAYWGAHTARALQNFPISHRPISIYPDLINALVIVKQAAARANRDIGVLDPVKADWIDGACTRVSAGAFHDQFVVDIIQGGAGTSTTAAGALPDLRRNAALTAPLISVTSVERAPVSRLCPGAWQPPTLRHRDATGQSTKAPINPRTGTTKPR